MGAGSNILQKL